MDRPKLEALAADGKATYEYIYGKCLNIFVQDNGFERLYFFAADAGGYHFNGRAGTYVCDLFSQKPDQGLEAVKELLISCGFGEYASYHKWSREALGRESSPLPDAGISFSHEWDAGALHMLYSYFDKYSDCLPDKGSLGQFLREKNVILAYGGGEREPLGGLVYGRKGNVLSEDFIFVSREARGHKVSELLQGYWLQTAPAEAALFVAWVRDDNLPSRALHKKHQFQEGGMKKTTLLKVVPQDSL